MLSGTAGLIRSTYRGGVGRPDRRLLGRQSPIRLRESQGPEYDVAKIRVDWMGQYDQFEELSSGLTDIKCGEGVPERTKGYFTSHLAAVSKIFHVR